MRIYLALGDSISIDYYADRVSGGQLLCCCWSGFAEQQGAEPRVGMRHVAVPTAEGFLSTADVEQAREIVAGMDFFETAFGADEDDQADLHAQVMATLLDEVHAWQEEPLGQQEQQ